MVMTRSRKERSAFVQSIIAKCEDYNEGSAEVPEPSPRKTAGVGLKKRKAVRKGENVCVDAIKKQQNVESKYSGANIAENSDTIQQSPPLRTCLFARSGIHVAIGHPTMQKVHTGGSERVSMLPRRPAQSKSTVHYQRRVVRDEGNAGFFNSKEAEGEAQADGSNSVADNMGTFGRYNSSNLVWNHVNHIAQYYSDSRESADVVAENTSEQGAVLMAFPPGFEKMQKISEHHELMHDASATEREVPLFPNPQTVAAVFGRSEEPLVPEENAINHDSPCLESPDSDECPSHEAANVASNNANGDSVRPQDASRGSSHNRPATSINLTEWAERLNEEDSPEVNSFESDTNLVTIGAYKVEPKYANILEDIVSKQGDIGANCCAASVTFRSFYMQMVCDLVQRLQQTRSFSDIKEEQLKNMLVSVSDIESQMVNVSWLRKRLEDILGAKQALSLLKSHADLKKKKTALLDKKQELEEELQVVDTELKEFPQELVKESKDKLRCFYPFGPLVNGLL